jgi:hypothetical protein
VKEKEMTEELTLEEIARMTGTRVELLRRAVKEGTLDARPHRTYMVRIEDGENVRDKVTGPIARMTAPSDHLDL